MKKKTTVILAIAALFTLTLQSCGPDSGSSDKGTAGAQEAPAKKKSGG